jgi:hypothetical protein
MIGKIRRILAQPVQEEKDWSLDEPLELQIEVEQNLTEETDRLAPPSVPALDVPRATIKGDATYYSNFVQSCITSGGKFGDHTISVRWLRMILAGLEGVELGPTDAWRLDEPGADLEGQAAEDRLYLDLFREKLTI